MFLMNNKGVDKTTFIIIMQHTTMHQLNLKQANKFKSYGFSHGVF